MESRAVPLRLDRARGVRYGELPPALLEALPRWLAARQVPEGEVQRGGRVWRVGDVAVKLFEPRPGPRHWLRRSPARRAAEVARRLPVRAPRPLAVLEQREGLSLGWSLLASEFVAGAYVYDAWPDLAARAAFTRFLARMHRARAFHGDLHARNVLWDGREWVLIDLDGMRSRMRSLRPRRLALDQWARLVCNMPRQKGKEEAFREYWREAGLRGGADAAWAAVLARARELSPVWSPPQYR